jgi:hypothetical protein
MQKIVGGAFHAHEFSGARDIAKKRLIWAIR